jgi:hypothetical protein
MPREKSERTKLIEAAILRGEPISKIQHDVGVCRTRVVQIKTNLSPLPSEAPQKDNIVSIKPVYPPSSIPPPTKEQLMAGSAYVARLPRRKDDANPKNI